MEYGRRAHVGSPEGRSDERLVLWSACPLCGEIRVTVLADSARPITWSLDFDCRNNSPVASPPSGACSVQNSKLLTAINKVSPVPGYRPLSTANSRRQVTSVPRSEASRNEALGPTVPGRPPLPPATAPAKDEKLCMAASRGVFFNAARD